MKPGTWMDGNWKSPGRLKNGVSDTVVQCESYRRSCGLQRCESDVPCDHLMVEVYTSYRRSSQDFSIH